MLKELSINMCLQSIELTINSNLDFSNLHLYLNGKPINFSYNEFYVESYYICPGYFSHLISLIRDKLRLLLVLKARDCKHGKKQPRALDTVL